MKALPLLVAFALAAAASPATAQTAPEPAFTLSCQDGNGHWANNQRQQTACETRELTLNLPAGQALTVDGATNGGISVHGWDGPSVRVRAKVQAWSATEAGAQAQLQAIKISSQDQTLRAEAPGTDANGNSWAVNYELFVPRQTSLVLRTVNGGIGVEGTQADVRFEAVNGGIALASLGGKVAGRTINGGLSISLSGRQWEGAGLDVATTNGGISWRLPTDYSAQFFTSTDVGGLSAGGSNLPVTKSGLLHREISTTLGQGGAAVRAVTTNGGVSVRQAKQ